jgi:hypothetical protein
MHKQEVQVHASSATTSDVLTTETPRVHAPVILLSAKLPAVVSCVLLMVIRLNQIALHFYTCMALIVEATPTSYPHADMYWEPCRASSFFLGTRPQSPCNHKSIATFVLPAAAVVCHRVPVTTNEPQEGTPSKSGKPFQESSTALAGLSLVVPS